MNGKTAIYGLLGVPILAVFSLFFYFAHAQEKINFAVEATATTSVMFLGESEGQYQDSNIVPLSAPKDSGIGAFYDRSFKVVCYTFQTSISCVQQ